MGIGEEHLALASLHPNLLLLLVLVLGDEAQGVLDEGACIRLEMYLAVFEILSQLAVGLRLGSQRNGHLAIGESLHGTAQHVPEEAEEPVVELAAKGNDAFRVDIVEQLVGRILAHPLRYGLYVVVVGEGKTGIGALGEGLAKHIVECGRRRRKPIGRQLVVEVEAVVPLAAVDVHHAKLIAPYLVHQVVYIGVYGRGEHHTEMAGPYQLDQRT